MSLAWPAPGAAPRPRGPPQLQLHLSLLRRALCQGRRVMAVPVVPRCMSTIIASLQDCRATQYGGHAAYVEMVSSQRGKCIGHTPRGHWALQTGICYEYIARERQQARAEQES